MKNIIIGLILGFALTLPFQAIANNQYRSRFEEDVVDFLEKIERHGEDISSDTQTLIDAVSRLPKG